MVLVLHQIHAFARKDGLDLIVPSLCARKFANTMEIVLFQIHAHVKEDGEVMTAPFPFALKTVFMELV